VRGGRGAGTGAVAGAVAGAVTLAAMIATPLMPPRSTARRWLSSVVVGGLWTTTTALTARRWGAGRAGAAAGLVGVATAAVEHAGTSTGLPFGRYAYTSALRPQVRIVAGRMFRAGSAEVIAGRAVASGFQGVEIGSTLRFGGRDWTVVGLFDAGRSGFDSEIWADAEQLMQAFRRQSYSAVVLRLADIDGFERLRDQVEGDPRLTHEAKREIDFYAEQSRALATFISYLGTGLSVIFSIGAVVGATITMFGSVASRVGEIGTLRALGFRRGAVLWAFLVEALLLGVVGGLVGLALASFMQLASFSTINFQTFADLSFRFILTPGIVAKTLFFALAMGLVGGFLPAFRAARLNIVDALRAI